jgi:release factor glutamine methyltransferase
MPTFRQALQINEQYAIDNGKEDSAIKRLLLHFSKMDSSEMLLRFDEEMPDQVYQDFLFGVDRYIIKNIPVQHIIGYEYFFGYQFTVSKDVLIPRFETEELVGHILTLYDDVFDGKEVEVVDIGTGSGCLAVTLDLEESKMHVTATDISEEALQVAKQNNDHLGANVTFYQGDMLEPIKDKKFDILVSNPPYIPEEEYVDNLVKDNEPHVALFGGEDGLYFYRKIIKDAETILNKPYIIAFEHAFDKANELKNMIHSYIKDATIIQKKDLQGKDRMTFVLKK